MQEDSIHLTKRHQVMELFHRNDYEEKNNHSNDWKSINIAPKEPVVMAKFSDGSLEKTYYCKKYPHWLYFNPNTRPPVITKDIIEWSYLT